MQEKLLEMMKYTVRRWFAYIINRPNLRASGSRVSRVEVNNQRLLVGRTLESLAVLILKRKVRSSLSNLEVESSVLSDGGGRGESRGRGACDGGDDGRGLHVFILIGLGKNFMMVWVIVYTMDSGGDRCRGVDFDQNVTHR